MKQTMLALAVAIASGCEDTTIIYPMQPSPTTTTTIPTNGPVSPLSNIVEYRVSGNASGATIRFSNPIDGLTSVVSGLPYVTSFATTQTNMFLSLEATPTGYSQAIFTPFISIQIFVNSVLFRESTASEFTLRTLSVSGTWRK